MDVVNQFILNPKYHEVLSILKGLRNGLVYGAKVRFPHALVMTFLFRSGSLRNKVRLILQATRAHAQNLGSFVVIYKTLMLVQRYLAGQKEASYHAFLAGLVGGYVVFGENTNINNQIVMYLFSRVAIGLAKLAVTRKVVEEPHRPFPLFAALVWGLVMWLFRHEQSTIQPSLRASMQYLYVDSNQWQSLRNLLWHNK
ncbi:Tim17/Tim22/Tim23/Pmp24 family-domain-containing protein [Dimargaris cristalligena]|uniref:Tim17/Tim22/Tim23/Pmp24 family-domain-containing protein n=1 Tax=Dimargaris cristalligena TaxID=215637 RepID=A0A4P9ZSR9_9FUNG|nr:Tim17/Tim22/Tim23/Pmp24 family-domain-containing protein [Dimargaris cristalligena]|eukprot:RKP36533.1 Tim17/Tim22/Tim23/Pmp24 family-domain-containing protein [Dimargaris cristalligena]